MPNGIVERTTGGGGGWPNTMVPPGAEPGALLGGAAGFSAFGGWLNTTVPVPAGGGGGAGGAGFFAAAVAGLMFPVWNIIVRPADSPGGWAGPAGAAAGRGGAVAGGGVAGFAAGSGGVAGAANIIVVCAAPGREAGTAPGRASFAWAASAGAGARDTLKVFWHLPHRMVSPCGPMRASSTR